MIIIGVSLLPSLSVYIRQANYEKLRKTAEKTGKTTGQIINELIEASQQ
jgi:predicted DNA-binding protein